MIGSRKIATIIQKLTWKSQLKFCSNAEYFNQSKQFWRPPAAEPKLQAKSPESVEELLQSYILEHCPKNHPQKTLEFIDKYCQMSWMMNLGPEKRKIFEKVITQNKIKRVLEIGTYCGYSAIALSQSPLQPQNKIISLEINKKFAEIAKKILAHSGVKNVNVLTQNIYQASPFLNEVGPFDLIFMDQEQDEYLKDLHFLEERNLIKTGAIIVADNVIYPGAPEYLAYMRESALAKKFKSTLYHTYDAYTDIPDGVLVSQKIY